jgi:transcriptional regulator with XRE-family HTH domain
MATNTTAARVAGKVRAALAEARVSRQSIADALGISLSAITRRLNAEIPFDVAELDKIAERLDLPMNALIVTPDQVAS